jgi:hypothetical protein
MMQYLPQHLLVQGINTGQPKQARIVRQRPQNSLLWRRRKLGHESPPGNLCSQSPPTQP